MKMHWVALSLLGVACGSTSSSTDGGAGGGGGGTGVDGGNTGGGAGGGGGSFDAGGCAATTYGSCLSADAGRCTDFTGTYWSSASARAGSCVGGQLSTCGCKTTGATGSCQFGTGLANAYTDYSFAADVRPFYDSCQNLGTWQSTPGSPDVTWWCKEQARASSSFNTTVTSCSKEWRCAGTVVHRFECARDGGSGAPYPYQCSCRVDGGVTGTYPQIGVCGSTTATAKDNDDLLADAGNVTCGWQAPNSPTIP